MTCFTKQRDHNELSLCVNCNRTTRYAWTIEITPLLHLFIEGVKFFHRHSINKGEGFNFNCSHAHMLKHWQSRHILCVFVSV